MGNHHGCCNAPSRRRYKPLLEVPLESPRPSARASPQNSPPRAATPISSQIRALERAELNCDPRRLEDVLTRMTTYLGEWDQDITIIGIGIGWFMFGNPDFPNVRKDFNYLKCNTTDEQLQLLDEAAEYAGGRTQPRMDRDWFKNRIICPPPEVQQMITREALANDLAIIQGNRRGTRNRGLRVLLAPREYAICAKLDMIYNTFYRFGRPIPSHEKRELAGYIWELIGRDVSRGLRKVHVQDIEKWARSYQLPSSVHPLQTVINYCRSRHLLVETDRGEGGNLLVPPTIATRNLLQGRDPANTLISYRGVIETVRWRP